MAKPSGMWQAVNRSCYFIFLSHSTHSVVSSQYLAAAAEELLMTSPPPLSGIFMFRASSRGSRRSQEPLDHYRENSINVYLQDVQHLVRRGIVGLPGPGQISPVKTWQWKYLQEDSQNLAIRSSFFQTRRDSPMWPRAIFIFCSNISYQLCLKLNR